MNNSFWTRIFILVLLFSIALKVPVVSAGQNEVSSYFTRIINSYPHNTKSSTQGLIFVDGVFYESTGFLQSALLRVELQNGKTLLRHELPEELFGEGLTLFGNKLYQLTWQAGKVFVYDKKDFNVLHEFINPGEGWGLTHDGKHLIMSDGTSTLYFIDPDTFKEIGQLTVSDELGPVTNLNELEYIHGLILANIYLSNEVVMIDSKTGKVTGRIDLNNLAELMRAEGIKTFANGIAYDQENNSLYLTGKQWSRVFEVELVDKESGQTFRWDSK